MKKAKILAGVLAVVFVAGLAGADSDAPSVQGRYVEARTCDVWTGPCFANGEIHVRGKQAVVGWVVDRGGFQGTELAGLNVAAAVVAEGTIGSGAEGKMQAVVFVDERASGAQAKALVALARSLAPSYLADIVGVERRTISYERKGMEATLAVGEVARIRTTAFCPCDAICCNEEQFYPAISGSTKVECAKTVEHEYKGKALDARWSEPNKRSAMLGTFAR